MKVKLLEIPWGVRYDQFKVGQIVEGVLLGSGMFIIDGTLQYWLPDEYEVVEE